MAGAPIPVPDPNQRLARVFDTEQESEAMVVRGLLESEGIDCEMVAIDYPQDVIPVGGTVILVRDEDAARARQLISEYRRCPDEESVEDDSRDEAAGNK